MKILKDNPYIDDGYNAYVYEHGYADGRKETAEELLYKLWKGIDLEAVACGNEEDKHFNYGLHIALCKVKNIAEDYGVKIDDGE